MKQYLTSFVCFPTVENGMSAIEYVFIFGL